MCETYLMVVVVGDGGGLREVRVKSESFQCASGVWAYIRPGKPRDGRRAFLYVDLLSNCR